MSAVDIIWLRKGFTVELCISRAQEISAEKIFLGYFYNTKRFVLISAVISILENFGS